MREDLGRKDVEGRKWVERVRVVSRAETNRAIREGQLKRKNDCYFCGKAPPLQKHHVSYINPHYILWVCPSCHVRIHAREKNDRLSHLAAEVGKALTRELR